MLNSQARKTNFFSLEHLSQAKEIREFGKDDNNDRTFAVRLNDVYVVMKADSGADVNIMDEHQFKSFIYRPNISTNNTVKLRTLQHKIEVEGEFQTVIRNRACGKATKFVVASGRIHSPPFRRIQTHGCFAEPIGLTIFKEGHSANTVKQEKGVQDMKDLTPKYSHSFQGIGKIKDKKE